MKRIVGVLIWVLVAEPGEAKVPFMSEIPNASGERCNTCHVSGGGSPRNAFGLDFWDFARDWAELSQEDSDGDGFSNGVELGDPEGVWVRGEDPPNSYLSHPGDPEDYPAGEPLTDGGPVLVDGGEPIPDGGLTPGPDGGVGCSCQGVDDSTWMLFGGILVIGIALTRRKGPRDRDR